MPAGRGRAAKRGSRYLLPLLVSLSACLLPVAVEARQMERVLSYDVTIDLEEDGWMEVTEKIRFRVSPREIEGRIRKDFPVGPPREGGFGRLTAPLEFVHRDVSTRLEVHSVGGSPATSGVGVWLGIPGRSISSGDHFYGFSYRTARWLVFDGDRTRLTWNVTRNRWSVPIQVASARVRLPGRVAADAVVLKGWTGPEPSPDPSVVTSFETDADSGSLATFLTGVPLRPDHDLTIQLDFPAGLVSPPTPEQRADWSRLDWKPYTDTALAVFGVLLFFVLVWAAVGRDPPGRPAVVQYDPPEGFSPAALGYLDRRGYDGRQLTAAIMSLSRKGVLEIEETGRDWTVRRIGPIPRTLPPDERCVAEELLPDEDALVVLGISRGRVGGARRALRKELKRRFRGRYFVANRWWFFLGLVLSLAGFALVVSRTRFGLQRSAWVPAAMLLVWGFPLGRLLTRGFHRWRIDLAETSPKPSLLAASIFPLLAMIPLAFLGVMAHELYQAVPSHLFLAALALSGVNAVFFQLLERPTVAGQDALNHVEGFKRFLTATEGDRIARLSSKESHELYERLLPCAVALGLSVRWGAAFDDAVNSRQ